ncbi:MAG: TrpB-like pyridoxal phosphate-dependent enzyme [Chloroflexota bacterium]|nr:TrpB-like pyridoxal phosphate-dependent enzyme [Chloroflexota bacterium]
MEQTKFLLPEKEMPTQWYNVLPDLPFDMPPIINPATGEPITPDELAPIFPMALIEQEMSPERYIDIPEEVREVYRLWRPTPMYRAHRLEEALDTPAKIYYKWEGVSPPGSHKPNTAVAQAFYNKQEGVKRITTETGAGQWGSALAFGCNLFGLECKIYMVRISYDQKPYRRILMETWGGECVPSPSEDTKTGRDILAKDPDSPGSLGIAISEAVEDAATHEGTKYALGSVLNHVLLHQTVVGQEAKRQMEMTGDYPDILIGCIGGGSNFAGFFLPFIKDKIEGRAPDLRVICVEPTACPSVTKGLYTYDFGDTACTTPLLRMYTLGHDFVPPPIHAGGLRYHGMAPIICALHKHGLIEARAYPQNPAFEAAVQFARTEGFIPAPEPAHAIKAVVEEALKCRESGEAKVIALAFSGHGHFDLTAYESYLAGELENYELPEEEVRRALASLPQVG